MTPRAFTHEERIAWWREAKFGMFIHWGLYAVPAGVWKGTEYDGIGEWIMFKARIPVDDYEALASVFDPTEFDADEWADLALHAGMKYMVITAKHHDGFAMFKSEASDFNIVDATPFGRDPVGELAAACASRGIRFGVYYSQAQDWHEPGGGIWPGRHENGPLWEERRWDPKQHGDFERYFESKAIPQVRELLTNYGPICLIWFDTPVDVMTDQRAEKLQRIVRDVQPNTLVSGRIGGAGWSDYDSEGDNRIPGDMRTGDWETPATLNDTWGFKTHDTNWKRPGDIVFKLVDIVSKGGNYLLNVGPDAKGNIPKASCDILAAVGEWVSEHGESIYGAGPTPFGSELSVSEGSRYRCTAGAECIYVHLFDWDRDRITLPAFSKASRATGAFLITGDDHAGLPLHIDGDDLAIELPAGAGAGPMPVVIRVEIEPD